MRRFSQHFIPIFQNNRSGSPGRYPSPSPGPSVTDSPVPLELFDWKGESSFQSSQKLDTASTIHRDYGNNKYEISKERGKVNFEEGHPGVGSDLRDHSLMGHLSIRDTDGVTPGALHRSNHIDNDARDLDPFLIIQMDTYTPPIIPINQALHIKLISKGLNLENALDCDNLLAHSSSSFPVLLKRKKFLGHNVRQKWRMTSLGFIESELDSNLVLTAISSEDSFIISCAPKRDEHPKLSSIFIHDEDYNKGIPNEDILKMDARDYSHWCQRWRIRTMESNPNQKSMSICCYYHPNLVFTADSSKSRVGAKSGILVKLSDWKENDPSQQWNIIPAQTFFFS